LHNFGFSLERKSLAHNYKSSLILIPLWLPLLMCLWIVESLRRFSRRALHRQRLEQGLCPQCGYDLRATPAACPECGFFLDLPPRVESQQKSN
jgi:hypothetical protein